MTNADKFKNLFGVYATELWSMRAKDFLKWLNSEVMNCSEIPNNSDLISRQAAIDAVEKNACNTQRIMDAVNNLPTAQPERKKGRWLPDNNSVYEMRFICSECKESEVVPTIGFTKYKPIWDFCPNCGADMRGERQK